MENGFDDHQHSPQINYKKIAGIFITQLAIWGAMRKGNYRAAFIQYPNTGGGGFNIYKIQDNGKYHRFFSLDYHPVFNQERQQKEWLLHYHRGNTINEIKKHRPYQGGW